MRDSRVVEQVEGELVSPELHALVDRLNSEFHRASKRPDALREALESLLAFLASPAGRTQANCHVVSWVFQDAEFPDLAADLPSGIVDVMFDMPNVDDTFRSPSAALNFESTPELLLARVRAMVL